MSSWSFLLETSLFFHIVSRNNEFFIQARTPFVWMWIEERFSIQSTTTITTNDDVVKSLFLAYTRASSTTRWLSYSGKTEFRFRFFSIFSSVRAHTDDISTMNISTVNFPNMKFYSLPHHVIIGTRSQCPKKSEREPVDIIKVLLVGSLFSFQQQRSPLDDGHHFPTEKTQREMKNFMHSLFYCSTGSCRTISIGRNKNLLREFLFHALSREVIVMRLVGEKEKDEEVKERKKPSNKRGKNENELEFKFPDFDDGEFDVWVEKELFFLPTF